ncbi:MAG: hypothetical protein FWC68_06395 [Oscillospiraceae bacterium]|nr:hypothetical protein [Oscillospiraceae bacterium]
MKDPNDRKIGVVLSSLRNAIDLREKSKAQHNIINFTIIYILFSYLVFRLGPIIYSHRESSLVPIYLTAYLIALKCGAALSDKIKIPTSKTTGSYTSFKVIVRVGLVFGILLSVLNVMNVFGTSIPELIRNVLRGFIDPEIGYFYNLNQEQGSSIITQMSTLLSPLTLFSMTLGFYFWKELSLIDKCLLTGDVLFSVIQTTMIGTNFGLFRLAIIGFISLFFGIQRNKVKLDRNRKIFTISVALISFLVVTFYFFHTTLSRVGWSEIPSTLTGTDVVNQQHWTMQLPLSISAPILMFTDYFSNGFNGLAIAKLFDFSSTFGFGSGRFLWSIPERLFSIDIISRTYQYKMAEMWHPSIKWTTAFTWIANDVSFLGVIPYLFIISLLFCLVFKDAKENKNPIAVAIVPLYIIMFIFLPLNNIVMSVPLLFFPFLIFHFIWGADKLLSRSKN